MRTSILGSVTVVALLTACGTGDAEIASVVPTYGATTAALSAVTNPGGVRPGTSVIPPAATPSASAAATATPVPNCASANLHVTLGPVGAAAGSVYRQLIFTNVGSAPCWLRGFPGVSYVAGDDGHQVGPAAATSGPRGGQVQLPHGGSAQAQLQLVQVGNFDTAACKPTPVRGLRVYPPNNTAALFVPMDGTGCSGTPPSPQLVAETVKPS